MTQKLAGWRQSPSRLFPGLRNVLSHLHINETRLLRQQHVSVKEEEDNARGRKARLSSFQPLSEHRQKLFIPSAMVRRFPQPCRESHRTPVNWLQDIYFLSGILQERERNAFSLRPAQCAWTSVTLLPLSTPHHHRPHTITFLVKSHMSNKRRSITYANMSN